MGRGLVDYPAIGIGSGYQFLVLGVTQPPATSSCPDSLRRRVDYTPQLAVWLNGAAQQLSPSHRARQEFTDLARRIHEIGEPGRGQEGR